MANTAEFDEAQRKVLGRLQNFCARQECCTRDLLSKAVKALDGDAVAASRVLAALVEGGYADDRRYAAAFAREKSSIMGWGPIKIRMALAAKGISAETASEALREIDPDRADVRLNKLLETKWRTLRDDPQGKLKLLRFALSRGYEYDAVRPAVEEIIARSGDEA